MHVKYLVSARTFYVPFKGSVRKVLLVSCAVYRTTRQDQFPAIRFSSHRKAFTELTSGAHWCFIRLPWARSEFCQMDLGNAKQIRKIQAANEIWTMGFVPDDLKRQFDALVYSFFTHSYMVASKTARCCQSMHQTKKKHPVSKIHNSRDIFKTLKVAIFLFL